MKRIIKINVIILSLFLTFFSILNYGYELTNQYFREGVYVNISNTSSESNIDLNEIEEIALKENVYVFARLFNEYGETYALSNIDFYFENEFAPNEYVSNCNACVNEQYKLTDLRKYPTYINNVYIYPFESLTDLDVSNINFEIKGADEDVQSFVNSLMAKGYEITFPQMQDIPPTFYFVKVIIVLLIFVTTISYIVFVFLSSKKISILRINGFKSSNLIKKYFVQFTEIFFVSSFVQICVVTIILLIFSEGTILKYINIYFTANFQFILFFLLFIFLSSLIIIKIGTLESLNGKMEGRKFIVYVSIFKYILVSIEIVIAIAVSLLIVPLYNINSSMKYYEKYEDYMTISFNYDALENYGYDAGTRVAVEFYEKISGNYEALLIDSTQLEDDRLNCPQGRATDVYCNSIYANVDYIEEMNIVDDSGKPISQQINKGTKTVLVPICKKDEVNEDELKTIDGMYNNILYTACDQQYSIIDPKTIVSMPRQTDTKTSSKDNIVYILNQNDEKTINLLMDSRGYYFIDATPLQINAIISEIDEGERFINKPQYKFDEFKYYKNIIKFLLIVLTLILILLIASIFYVLVIELGIYTNFYEQKLKILSLLGYGTFSLFKNKIICETIYCTSMILLITWINYYYHFNILSITIVLLILIVYILFVFKSILNVKRWRKNG